MPEIKHHFRAGKMNQDLDERLIPNGEYRDALNIEIASSEGDDVGSIQTIPGNSRITTLGIAGAECIGSYVDHENDKIYWFISGTLIDAIAEYDPRTDTVVPVLVDSPATNADAILEFSKYWHICGINIIDGLLFWTTGNTEPKMINIKTFKAGSTDFSTTTTVVNQHNGSSGQFSLSDITVIKKGPTIAPTLTMSNTKRSGIVESTFTAMGSPIVNNSFTVTDSLGDIVPVETTINPFIITILGSNIMDWQVGDKLRATLAGGLSSEEAILNIVQTFTTSPNQFRVTIDAISQEIEQGQQVWDISLVEEKPMFEFKFPRFALRYKFRDGQYSPIGPFSELAFIPDEFDYQAKKGYNLGMKNNIRSLKISGFANPPLNDIIEIDILYKESNHNNIYTVQSIKCETGKHDPEYTADELEITSDIIHAVVPSNQLLRHWDNVPREARAQEITGNRLVYGNFTHQYNLTDANGGEITPRFEVTIGQNNSILPEPRTPSPSIKSLRTYQVGVVYVDAYGRETPVLTDPSGSFTLDKQAAVNYNVMQVKMLSNAPSWAASYKFFIKEPSNEYYNVAMDRHYEAEDGNAWISFPSSERNKVHEDRFLILKKEHDTDIFVPKEARYKVLAVENEAPDFLRIENITQGQLECDDNGDLFLSLGYPSTDHGHVAIPGDRWHEIFGSADPTVTNNNIHTLALHAKSDLVLRIYSGSRETKFYDVANIQYVPADPGNYADGTNAPGNDYYKVEIDGKFEEGDTQWLGSVADNNTLTNLNIEFYQKRRNNKPEFTGRFFAKLNKDSTLEDAILSKANDDDHKIIQSIRMWEQNTDTRNIDYWQDAKKFSNGERGSGWFIDRAKKAKRKGAGGSGTDRNTGYPAPYNKNNNWKGMGVQAGMQVVEFAYHWFGHKATGSWDGQWHGFETSKKPQYADMVKQMQSPGALFRFGDDPNQTIYTIVKYKRNHWQAYSHKNGKFSSSRIISWTLELDKPIVWAPEDETTTINGTNYSNFGGSNLGGSTAHHSRGDVTTPIEFLEKFSDTAGDDSDRSKNPAIFETEPLEDTDLDLYFEATHSYPIGQHANQQTLPYMNCYSFNNGVESNRIRDDFNAVTIAKGIKASTVLAEKYETERRKSGLIFSGLYNSNSGTNQLNQFIMAEAITKDLDPSYGSIQKLHARDTNLITLCEDKCLRILADKDALFNADGSANMVAANRFLGQTTPYVGEFGISKNPESFASYGYQAYFTDKNRGAVIRLSMDGITNITEHGMSDYFSDKLGNAARHDLVIGTYNEAKRLYNVTIKNSGSIHQPVADRGDTTVSFSEAVTGWTSRKSFSPESGVSLNDKYYTFKQGDLYEHGVTTSYSTFYGTAVTPLVRFIFSDMPSVVKTYKTLNYEGTQAKWLVNTLDNEYYNNFAKAGWYNQSVETDLQDGKITTFKNKENKWFNFIEGLSTDIKNIDTNEFAVQGVGQGTVTADTGSFNELTLTINENND